MPSGSSSGGKQRPVVQSSIQGLMSCAGLPTSDNGLDVLSLAECDLRYLLTLRELRQVLSSERGEAESRAVEVRRLEERMSVAEDDLESLRVACVRVDKLTAERASLAAGTDPAKLESGTLAARIRDLEVAAGTRYRELGVVVQSVRTLKGPMAAG